MTVTQLSPELSPELSSAPPMHTSRVDDGDAVRARIHFLVAQNHAIITQTQFADAKAAALLTLMGLLALRGPLPVSNTLLTPTSAVVLAFIAASLLLCLWALIPRFGKHKAMLKGQIADRFTWTALSGPDVTVDAQAAFVRSGEFVDLMDTLTVSNVGASRVLRKKFTAMRYAFFCGIATVPAYVVHLLA